MTEAGKKTIPLGDAMALTGHRSVQTAMGYYREGDVGKSNAAKLMDLGANPSTSTPNATT
jgi:hypothetical protein